MSVGQEAGVADPAEAVGDNMEQEATDEFVCVERHHLRFVGLSIVFPAEPDLSIVDFDEAAVGDGHSMSVAAEIVDHLLWTAEWAFAIHHPFGPAQRLQISGERRWIRECGEAAEKVQRP